jgi:hypothetical protein
MYYNPFGQPVREESWKAVNPTILMTLLIYGLNDPTKVVERCYKIDGHTLRHGTSKFFDLILELLLKQNNIDLIN